MNARPKKTNELTMRRLAIRLGAGTILLLALGGPTPGYIGSCSVGQSAPVDAEQFCVNRKSAECVRDRVAMRTNQVMYEACANAILTQCEGATWICEPSAEMAAACIEALRDSDRLGMTNDMIVECSQDTFCGGAPLTLPPDDGI